MSSNRSIAGSSHGVGESMSKKLKNFLISVENVPVQFSKSLSPRAARKYVSALTSTEKRLFCARKHGKVYFRAGKWPLVLDRPIPSLY